MIGTVGITKENNVFISFGTFYIEMWGLKGLERILSAKEWDTDGYFVLETNYGDEYYEITEYLQDRYTADELREMAYLSELAQVERFEVACF